MLRSIPRFLLSFLERRNLPLQTPTETTIKMTPQTRLYDDLIVQIVDHVYDRDISTDQDALRMARLCLLDALGCASESIATNQEVHKLIGPYVPGTVVPNGFHLPGTSFILDAVKGAFDLGVLIRYLDHNDGFTGLEWGHPSGNHTLGPNSHLPLTQLFIQTVSAPSAQ